MVTEPVADLWRGSKGEGVGVQVLGGFLFIADHLGRRGFPTLHAISTNGAEAFIFPATFEFSQCRLAAMFLLFGEVRHH